MLSHKKEQMWFSWTEADEPRACYTEWSKPERENKFCRLTHIYIESIKIMLMNLFAGHE